MTSLTEDGKYDIQEFNYPVTEDQMVYNITGYSENSPDTWTIDFTGSNVQGIAIGVLKNHLEIFDSNGSTNPPPPTKPCCPP